MTILYVWASSLLIAAISYVAQRDDETVRDLTARELLLLVIFAPVFAFVVLCDVGGTVGEFAIDTIDRIGQR